MFFVYNLSSLTVSKLRPFDLEVLIFVVTQAKVFEKLDRNRSDFIH